MTNVQGSALYDTADAYSPVAQEFPRTDVRPNTQGFKRGKYCDAFEIEIPPGSNGKTKSPGASLSLKYRTLQNASTLAKSWLDTDSLNSGSCCPSLITTAYLEITVVNSRDFLAPLSSLFDFQVALSPLRSGVCASVLYVKGRKPDVRPRSLEEGLIQLDGCQKWGAEQAHGGGSSQHRGVQTQPKHMNFFQPLLPAIFRFIRKSVNLSPFGPYTRSNSLMGGLDVLAKVGLCFELTTAA